MLLGQALPKQSHLFSPVGPFKKERNFPRSLGRRNYIEEHKRLLRQIGRFRKRREEITQSLLMNAMKREGDSEIRNLILIRDGSSRSVQVRSGSAQISDDSLSSQCFQTSHGLRRIRLII